MLSVGRPYVVDGSSRAAAAATDAAGDWSLPLERSPSAGITLAAAHALAKHWAAMGAAEHASVASFAQHSLDLMGVGAPASLVQAVHQAAADEVNLGRLSSCCLLTACNISLSTHYELPPR